MQRTDASNRGIDLFGPGKDGFVPGVPGRSEPTRLSAKFMNAVQEAIVRVIERADLPLSDDHDQFGDAIVKLMMGGIDAIQVGDYSALRAYGGVHKAVNVVGYLGARAPSGIAGCFVLDESDNTSTDNGGTIIVDDLGRRWKRVYERNAVQAEWFGADPSHADNAVPIQAAIDVAKVTGGVVKLGLGVFDTLREVRLYPGVLLVGAAFHGTKIRKLTNARGTTGIVKSLTDVDDDYDVDAIVSVVHPEREYAYNWGVACLSLVGAAEERTEYGIFAPRVSNFKVEDVYMYNVVVGWRTFDAWRGTLRNTIVDFCDIGYEWARDGSGNATGDSITLDNTWVVNARRSGYRFYGLTYSSFINVACDKFNVGNGDEAAEDINASDPLNAAYSFDTCTGIEMSGVGAERIHGTVFASVYSKIAVSALKSYLNYGYQSGSAGATPLFIDGGEVAFRASYFGLLDPPGNFYNKIIQNGAQVIAENSVLPSGGNNFTSYSGGGSLTVIGQGEVLIFNAQARNEPVRLGKGPQVRRFTRAPFADGVEVLCNVPSGAILRRVRAYISKKPTAFTGLQVGNQLNPSAYLGFDAFAQEPKKWVEYVPGPGDELAPDPEAWQPQVFLTNGARGCEGVIEIEYFVP